MPKAGSNTKGRVPNNAVPCAMHGRKPQDGGHMRITPSPASNTKLRMRNGASM